MHYLLLRVGHISLGLLGCFHELRKAQIPRRVHASMPQLSSIRGAIFQAFLSMQEGDLLSILGLGFD
jgi:hypothetical protein